MDQTPDLADLRADGVTVVDEPTGKVLLRAIGVEAPPGMVIEAPAEVAAAVTAVGLPCVIKFVAHDLPHKSDAGGVSGPLRSVREAEAAAEKMFEVAPAAVSGLLVEAWVKGEAEVFMGLTMGTAYGPVIVLGVGGVWVEEYGDVAYRLAPVDEDEALAMIRSRRAARLLLGRHGTSAVALDEFASTIHRFSQLALRQDVIDNVLEIEVNPLIVRADAGPVAVDCTVVLRTVDGADDPLKTTDKESKS